MDGRRHAPTARRRRFSRAVGAGAALACLAWPGAAAADIFAKLATTHPAWFIAALASLAAFIGAAGMLVLTQRYRIGGSRTSRLVANAERLAADALRTGHAGAMSWPAAGATLTTPGFGRLVGAGRDAIDFDGLVGALDPGSGAALAAAVKALRAEGKDFVMTVRGRDGKRLLKAVGRRQRNGRTADILWLHDATDTLGALIERDREAHRLRTLIDAVPIPLWSRDAARRIDDCNAAYVRAVEAESREAVTRDGREFAEGPQAEAARQLAERARGAGRVQAMQQHIVVGGARRLYEIAEAPANGARTAGFALDVTSLEETRGQLNRQQSAQNEVLERLAVAILTVGPDGHIRFFNGAFARLWGLNEPWLENRPHLSEVLETLREQRMLPETGDFPGLRRQWLGWLTGLIEPRQELLHLPNGMAIWMVVSPHPLGGLLMTFENVTYRLALERSVNTLAAVQRDTLDHLFDGVAVFGEDGLLKLSNAAFRTIWNLPDSAVSGAPHVGTVLDLCRPLLPVPQAGWDRLKSRLLARLTGRTMRTGRVRRTDGVSLAYALVPLPDGGMLASFRDITDSERVAKALRERAEAMEQADRVKADFIANISYELRTPLNAIIGFTEILNNQYFGQLSARQGEYTAGILEASQRLLSLINDILDLAVIEAGRMVLDIEPVSVRNMIESCVQLTGEWAREQQIQLEGFAQPDVGLIQADERRLKHALFNLIGNAIKFTPPGGRVVVTAERAGPGEVALAVEDTGIGIAEADRERVFEKFVRGRAADGRSPGAGLGLSLVRSLVELHGGRVELTSTPGKGTRVVCILPVRAKQPDALLPAAPKTETPSRVLQQRVRVGRRPVENAAA
jgi:signal transduction histidine kinase